MVPLTRDRPSPSMPESGFTGSRTNGDHQGRLAPGQGLSGHGLSGAERWRAGQPRAKRDAVLAAIARARLPAQRLRPQPRHQPLRRHRRRSSARSRAPSTAASSRASRASSRRTMHMLVSSGHARRRTERRAFDFLRQRRCDALILQLDGADDDEVVAWAAARRARRRRRALIAALADRCVYLDNVAGGYLATRHLLDRGHRRSPTSRASPASPTPATARRVPAGARGGRHPVTTRAGRRRRLRRGRRPARHARLLDRGAPSRPCSPPTTRAPPGAMRPARRRPARARRRLRRRLRRHLLAHYLSRP
jgi:hypothetical protein